MDKTFFGDPEADLEVKVLGGNVVLIMREDGRLMTRRLTGMEAYVMAKAMKVASQTATININSRA